MDHRQRRRSPSTPAAAPLALAAAAALAACGGGGSRSETRVLEGETCQLATPIADPAALGTVTYAMAGYANDYPAATNGLACKGSTGPERVFTLDVPAGQRVTATMAPAAGVDGNLSLVVGTAAACEGSPRSCVAGADSAGAGGTETLRWTNDTGAAQTAFLLAGEGAAIGPFDLDVRLDTPAPGDTCVNAIPIGYATSYDGTTVGFAGDYGPGTQCAGTGGADRVYVLTVPAGNAVEAVVTPTSSWDPSIALVAGPASSCAAVPRVCLAGADQRGTGGHEIAYWVNSSPAPLDVFIVIGSSSALGSGSFALTVW